MTFEDGNLSDAVTRELIERGQESAFLHSFIAQECSGRNPR